MKNFENGQLVTAQDLNLLVSELNVNHVLAQQRSTKALNAKNCRPLITVETDSPIILQTSSIVVDITQTTFTVAVRINSSGIDQNDVWLSFDSRVCNSILAIQKVYSNNIITFTITLDNSTTQHIFYRLRGEYIFCVHSYAVTPCAVAYGTVSFSGGPTTAPSVNLGVIEANDNRVVSIYGMVEGFESKDYLVMTWMTNDTPITDGVSAARPQRCYDIYGTNYISTNGTRFGKSMCYSVLTRTKNQLSAYSSVKFRVTHQGKTVEKSLDLTKYQTNK